MKVWALVPSWPDGVLKEVMLDVPDELAERFRLKEVHGISISVKEDE